MTTATRRPFTVVCCEGCDGATDLDVLQALGPSIRRCDNAVLVRAGCLLGPLACAVHRRGAGVMVVLQPCSLDRRPRGAPRWVGPIRDAADLGVVGDWLELGEWDPQTLPGHLRPALPTAASIGRN